MCNLGATFLQFLSRGNFNFFAPILTWTLYDPCSQLGCIHGHSIHTLRHLNQVLLDRNFILFSPYFFRKQMSIILIPKFGSLHRRCLWDGNLHPFGVGDGLINYIRKRW
jgi:hypothetical protein